MKNWKQIASAANLDIPAEQMDRIAPVLDGLEAAFGALARDIPPDLDPAVTLHLEGDAE